MGIDIPLHLVLADGEPPPHSFEGLITHIGIHVIQTLLLVAGATNTTTTTTVTTHFYPRHYYYYYYYSALSMQLLLIADNSSMDETNEPGRVGQQLLLLVIY